MGVGGVSLPEAKAIPCFGTPAFPLTFSGSPYSLADWATLPLPPLPIQFLASGSWRQLGRPTNFSPGHFLTPSPPSAFFSSPSAPFERRHPGPERVLQFNYFQILCSGHPGTPLSAIESAGRPAGAPQPVQALNPLGLCGSGPCVKACPLRSRPRLPFLDEIKSLKRAGSP